MSADLPPAMLPIITSYMGYGKPVLAGYGFVNQRHGWRGVSSQINHAYAYNVHVLASYYPLDANDTPFFTTTAAAADDVTAEVSVELGADVKYLAAQADIEDGVLTLTTTLNSGAAGAVAGRSVATATTAALSDQTGATVRAKIQLHNTLGGTAKIYSYILYEVVLASTDIP